MGEVLCFMFVSRPVINMQRQSTTLCWNNTAMTPCASVTAPGGQFPMLMHGHSTALAAIG